MLLDMCVHIYGPLHSHCCGHRGCKGVCYSSSTFPMWQGREPGFQGSKVAHLCPSLGAESGQS